MDDSNIGYSMLIVMIIASQAIIGLLAQTPAPQNITLVDVLGALISTKQLQFSDVINPLTNIRESKYRLTSYWIRPTNILTCST